MLRQSDQPAVVRLHLQQLTPLDGLRRFTYQAFEMVYRYRFVFLHSIEICLRIPSLKKCGMP